MGDTHTFGLIIPRRSDSELLLQAADNHYSLPSVVIPQKTRPAQQITSQVREHWNLRAVCRGNDHLSESDGEIQYQIVEPTDQEWAPSDGLCWTLRTDLNSANCSSQQLAIVERALHPTVDQGPFAKADWLHDLLNWMKSPLCSAGLTLTGEFEQLNSSECFNLIRFETNRGAVWFKAVGKPNLREYAITVGLAERYPQFLPRIFAECPEWNGWLMEESGTSLRHFMELTQWQNAAVTLGTLQLACLGKTEELLKLGCEDMRLSRIIDEIEPFLEIVTGLMQKQVVTPPSILNSEELRTLAKKLRTICLQLIDCGIPDSLLHGDFSPGSILVTADRCVFTDWAEGYVGHPFITFEHMLAHLRKSYPELAHWQNDLRASYERCWQSILTPSQIVEAFRLMPVVAILSYTLARGSWKDKDRVSNPNVAKCIRGLARRMHRGVADLETLEISCTN